MEKFNERKAIQEELEFIKEQSRKDFELYFEMRKERTRRFDELVIRLRELDERDIKLEREPVPTPAPTPVEPKVRFADLTREQQIVDRLKEESKQVVPTEVERKERNAGRREKAKQVSDKIFEYLTAQNRQVSTAELARMIEEETGHRPSQMSDVMGRAIGYYPQIAKHTAGKRAYYSVKQGE